MKSNYHEKREARIERLNDLAAKNSQLSDQLAKQSSDMASVIPFGQPILVGHHSEKRDRNYRDKIHNKMGAAVAASKKADYYADKAEAAENNTAISSDNPDAIQLLEEKLAMMVKNQEAYKAINKIILNRKFSDEQKAEAMEAAGFGKYKKLIGPDHCGRIGVASYILTNNNANMARVKERIQQLKKVEAMEKKEIQIGDVSIFSSPDTNRVQIFFPDKPAEAVRTELKQNGFRWAPSEGAWQKNLSQWAEKQAQEIATKYYNL